MDGPSFLLNLSEKKTMPTNRSEALLDLIRRGLVISGEHQTRAMLGERLSYVGMSDIGQFIQCPRVSIIHRLSLKKADEKLSRTLTLQRGHWFEDGIAKTLSALNLPVVRQLEIAVDNDGCPVRAHLDFLLVSVQPCPTVRVLEVKSCGRLPDTLHASYETQAYGQISMLNRYWNTPSFNLRNAEGNPLFSGLTFPQVIKALWGVAFPEDPEQVDMEAWVLALSMTDATAFGPYLPNESILTACLSSARDIWQIQEQVQRRELDVDGLPTPSGFHPLCSCCEASSGCPKFAGASHPELEPSLDELALWKDERSALDEKIREREGMMKEWYAHADIQAQWIEAGATRFRVTQNPGRRTLDRDSLAGELVELFHVGGMDDVDVPALIARHEKIGAPSARLFINTTNRQEKNNGLQV